MKIARFSVNGWESHGLVEGDRVRAIQGDIFGSHAETQVSYPLARVKLLPPTRPKTFWAVGLNYAAHIAHQEVALDTARIQRESQGFRPWHKGAHCMIGQDDPVVIPSDADHVHYEGELVIVIGRPARRITRRKHLTSSSATRSAMTSAPRAHGTRIYPTGVKRAATRSARWVRGSKPMWTRITWKSSPGSTAARRTAAVPGHGSQLLRHRERHQQIRHPAPGRHHTHRSAGRCRADPPRGCGGGRDSGNRHPAQSRCRGELALGRRLITLAVCPPLSPLSPTSPCLCG